MHKQYKICIKTPDKNKVKFTHITYLWQHKGFLMCHLLVVADGRAVNSFEICYVPGAWNWTAETRTCCPASNVYSNCATCRCNQPCCAESSLLEWVEHDWNYVSSASKFWLAMSIWLRCIFRMASSNILALLNVLYMLR